MTAQRSMIMARTPIHPGEHFAEELCELGLSAAEPAADRGAGEPGHRDCQWSARYHGRHGAAPWTLVQDKPAIKTSLLA